ncbi:unnamed protein product [Umbelopsis sp. WA50703]
MEDNRNRRDLLYDEGSQEQSIADDNDAQTTRPMRAQQGVYSDQRLGDVDVEAYGGRSPNFGSEKTTTPSKRPLARPKTQFSGGFASFHVEPMPPAPEKSQKEYSWIDEINNTAKAEKLEDQVDADEDESFLSKVLEYFVPSSHDHGRKYAEELSSEPQALQKQPGTKSRSVLPKNANKQHEVEVEPSEGSYDDSQASFSNKIDDTSNSSQVIESRPEDENYNLQQQSIRFHECNPSDARYDDIQISRQLDDNSRRQAWSANNNQVAGNAISGNSHRNQHASFGTRKHETFHPPPFQYPGSTSPNWAAGMGYLAAQPDIDKSISESGAYKRNRQSSRDSMDVATPSSYLSRPPMVASALAMEALNNPSEQPDWLSDNDMGLDQLFEEQPRATRQSFIGYGNSSSSVGGKNQVSKSASLTANRTHHSDQRPEETSALPTNSERPIACLLVMESSQNMLGGIYQVSKSASLAANRTHHSDQRPEETSALPTNTEGSIACLLVMEASQNMLAGKYLVSKSAFWAANRTHHSDQRPEETSALPTNTEGPIACLLVMEASQNMLAGKYQVSKSAFLAANRTHHSDQRPKVTSQSMLAGKHRVSKSAFSAANRTHYSDQRPKETSALPTITEGPTACLPVMEASPNMLSISTISSFPSQDISGDYDKAPASWLRVHQFIQRPMDGGRRREAPIDDDLPPEIDRHDSWSSYIALNSSAKGSEDLNSFESPGSKCLEHPRNRSSDISPLPKENTIDLTAALENFRKNKRYSRQTNKFKDWAAELSHEDFESLYPNDFEERWASTAEKPSEKSSENWNSTDIPTWTSSTAYGITAPFDAQPVSLDTGARETSFPTQDHSASNYGSYQESVRDNRSKSGAAVPVPPNDAYFDNPLHDMIGVVAAGVGAVAGTTVGAMTYLFGDHASSTTIPAAPKKTEQTESAKLQKESSGKKGFAVNMKFTALDQQFYNEQHRLSTGNSCLIDGRYATAEDQLFSASEQNPGLSLGHIDDDEPAVLLQPKDSRSAGLHTKSDEKRSVVNMGATAADQQFYNGQHLSSLETSNVPRGEFVTAGDQLVAAKEQNTRLSNGPNDDRNEAAVLLHPQLSQPTERSEASNNQPISSSMNAKTLEYENGVTGSQDQQPDNEMAQQVLPVAVGIGSLGAGGLASASLEQKQSRAKANEAKDRELEPLFDPDPDTVRQPYHPIQARKSSMDNRRQIWEANLSTALGQAATALHIQPRSKEEKRNFENYHVVDGPYKPFEHELGHNQFDSDFENWKCDSPSKTPIEKVPETSQDDNVAIANIPSNDMSQNHEQQSGGGSFTSDAAWERVSFHDPSDYMKNASSTDQGFQGRSLQQSSNRKKSKNPASWLRRKLGRKHANESS